MTEGSEQGTMHAPAERSDAEALETERRLLSSVKILEQVLDALPTMTMVLNMHRQIVAANKALRDGLGADFEERFFGMRPGEALQCVHAGDGQGGCGTSKHCRVCGAVNTILEAQFNRTTVTRDCRLTVMTDEREEPLDLRITAAPLEVPATDGFLLVSLSDVSHENRRRVLERIFFHDVLNTAGSVEGYLRCLLESSEPADLRSGVRLLLPVVTQLVSEIQDQRVLWQAERSELEPRSEVLSSLQIIRDLQQAIVHHPVALNRTIRVAAETEDVVVESDPTLVRRILLNMLKNACEASRPGETVWIGSRRRHAVVVFWVVNNAVIPEEDQLRIFQRSFSTRGSGRGLGTYSMRLLARRYLGGTVTFSSSEESGTTFSLELPLRFPQNPSPEAK